MPAKLDLAEELRAAAESYRLEAARCSSTDNRAALEAQADEMEARYLNLTGRRSPAAARLS
jgi:hypothetical protein